MFLTRDQLFELTGYRMKSKQVSWLRQRGINYHVARDGYARVLLSSLETPAPPRKAVPNFECLKKAG
jgi:hypothetical protein